MSNYLKNLLLLHAGGLGNLNTLVCGGVVVSFNPFSVRIGSLQVWGEGKFAGLGGVWHVSSSFSLSKTFQDVIKRAENQNQAKTLSEYVEKLESQGQLRKAALLKKKVLEQARTGHVSLTLAAPVE